MQVNQYQPAPAQLRTEPVLLEHSFTADNPHMPLLTTTIAFRCDKMLEFSAKSPIQQLLYQPNCYNWAHSVEP